MEYDEIRITTRREIEICRQAIARIERRILELESTVRSETGIVPPGSQSRQQLLDERAALDRWQRRLDEHRQIMEL